MKKAMPQMARTGKNKYGDPKPKIICKMCKLELRQSKFSRINKNDESKGIRPNCKSCSAKKAIIEKERRKNNWKTKPAYAMLNNSKQRAKAAGLEHTLIIEDIIIPDYCPVLGIKLETGDRKKHFNSPSIDRIYNNKGYTKDNIVIVSTRANLLKKDATIDELNKLSNFYNMFNNKE